jgi:hypothetical protein
VNMFAKADMFNADKICSDANDFVHNEIQFSYLLFLCADTTVQGQKEYQTQATD